MLNSIILVLIDSISIKFYNSKFTLICSILIHPCANIMKVPFIILYEWHFHYCFPARQNRYIFIPLLFLCGCIGRCMLCRSLSNLLFEPLDNRLSGWWQEPISSRSSVLSPLETLSFRSWISAYVPPNRVLLHTPTAFPWRTLRSAFHRIPQGSKGFRYGAFHGNKEFTSTSASSIPSTLSISFSILV